jgi:hypothetical protein
MLQPELVLMQTRSARGEPYTRLNLALGLDGYSVVGKQVTARPPKNAFWLEQLSADRKDPSVLHRRPDSIAVQVQGGDPAAAAGLLSLILTNLPNLKASLTQATQADIPQPSTRTSTFQPSEGDVARFIAKIGFNLLAFTCGDLVCRDRKFDELCEFIRTGSSDRQVIPWPDTQGFAPLLRNLFA